MSLQAIIKTNKGEIKLNLFPDVAPITVLNFVTLAKIVIAIVLNDEQLYHLHDATPNRYHTPQV